MTIDVSCEKCGKAYRVPDHMSGKRVKCARCGEAFTVFPPLAELGADDEILAADLLTGAEDADPLFGAQVADPLFGSVPPAKPKAGRLLPVGRGRGGKGAVRQGPVRDKLMLAVLLGMVVALFWSLGVLVAFGLGPRLIPSGVLLAIGVVILIGGLTSSAQRPSRGLVKTRALKSLGWCFGGLVLIGASLGGMLIFAKIGYYIPSVVHLVMPFLIVGALVAVLAAVVLGYQLVVLMFPRANIFRIGGWVYVALTFVVPGFMLMLFAAEWAVTVPRAVDKVAVRAGHDEPDEAWGRFHAAVPDDPPPATASDPQPPRPPASDPQPPRPRAPSRDSGSDTARALSEPDPPTPPSARHVSRRPFSTWRRKR